MAEQVLGNPCPLLALVLRTAGTHRCQEEPLPPVWMNRITVAYGAHCHVSVPRYTALYCAHAGYWVGEVHDVFSMGYGTASIE